MKITLPYGKDETVAVELDDARVAGFLEPNPVEIKDEAQALRRAVDAPIGAPLAHWPVRCGG